MRTLKINGKEFNVADTDKYRSFWDNASSGKWEVETFNIFDAFLKPDKSFIDIGAWIGVTALYGSKIAKSCFALEPDRLAFQEFITNVNLNPTLKIIPFMSGLSDVSGITSLYSRTSFGDSQSSLVGSEIDNRIDVHTFNFADLISLNKRTDVNFIKMDIEGGESIALPGMMDYLREHKPTLYLSVHPYWFYNRMAGCNVIMKLFDIYHIVCDYGFRPVNKSEFENKIRNSDLFGIDNREMEILFTT